MNILYIANYTIVLWSRDDSQFDLVFGGFVGQEGQSILLVLWAIHNLHLKFFEVGTKRIL